MSPFDNVTVDIVRDGITYTYGGTVVCTYEEKDGTSMCGISLLNNDGVIYLPTNSDLINSGE